MPNNNWNMGVDLLPSTTETFNLGNASKKWLVNGYTLGDACAKAVDTSISSDTTSMNVPTSLAVKNYVDSHVGQIYVSDTTLVINSSAITVSGTTLIIT